MDNHTLPLGTAETQHLKTYYNNLDYFPRLQLMPGRFGLKLGDNLSPIEIFKLTNTRKFRDIPIREFPNNLLHTKFALICNQLQQDKLLDGHAGLANLRIAMAHENSINATLALRHLSENKLLEGPNEAANREVLEL